MVKSNSIYAPQSYVEAITGYYYFFKNKEHPADEIQYLLAMNECELWDYPLTEIDHIVENNLNVVLVDCSHYEGDVYVNEYRWFEVPEDFKEEESMYSHYVVVLDWATEYDEDRQILGVAHTLDDAKNIFYEHIKEQKMIAHDNAYYIEEDNGVMFNAGIMGCWRDNHITLYIQGVH